MKQEWMLLLLLTVTDSLAEEKIWGTPVESPAVRTEPNKSFMFSDGGPTDRDTIKVTGNEKWYGFYVSLDKKKIQIEPTTERNEKVYIRDYDGVSWSLRRVHMEGKQQYVLSEVNFFGIPDLENGPKEGSLAVLTKEECEREGQRPVSIWGVHRGAQKTPVGAKICALKTWKYTLGTETVKFTREYTKSTSYADIFKFSFVFGGPPVELVVGEGPAVRYLMDLGNDGSLEIIFNYYKTDGGEEIRYIRMVRVSSGKVQILYDGIDPFWH